MEAPTRRLIEPRKHRSSEGDGSVFSLKRFEDCSVGISVADSRPHFAQHLTRVRAPNVIALNQDLAATTDTHHLMAKGVVAGGRIRGSCREEDEQSYKAYCASRRSRISFYLHSKRRSRILRAMLSADVCDSPPAQLLG